MIFNTTTTVSELAAELPRATRVMDKLKIDYSCDGNRTFEQACVAAGLETNDVLRQIVELAEVPGAAEATARPGESPQADFTFMTLPELTVYLRERHHQFTWQEMERITLLANQVSLAHVGNHPELVSIESLFRGLCTDLRPHMLKEERILFPYIDGLQLGKPARQVAPPPFGSLPNPVRMMMAEHEATEELLQAIRKACNNFVVPPDGDDIYRKLYRGLEALEQDLQQHLHLENDILFPRALEFEGVIH